MKIRYLIRALLKNAAIIKTDGECSTCEGNSIVEKLLSNKKAYKMCYKGKFVKMITSEEEFGNIFSDKQLNQDR